MDATQWCLINFNGPAFKKKHTHNSSFWDGLSFKERPESLRYRREVQDAVWFPSEVCYVKIELLPAVDLIFDVSNEAEHLRRQVSSLASSSCIRRGFFRGGYGIKWRFNFVSTDVPVRCYKGSWFPGLVASLGNAEGCLVQSVGYMNDTPVVGVMFDIVIFFKQNSIPVVGDISLWLLFKFVRDVFPLSIQVFIHASSGSNFFRHHNHHPFPFFF